MGKTANNGKSTLDRIQGDYQDFRSLVEQTSNNSGSVEDVLRLRWDLWNSVQKPFKECQKRAAMASQQIGDASNILAKLELEVASHLRDSVRSTSVLRGRFYQWWKSSIPQTVHNTIARICETLRVDCKTDVPWEFLISKRGNPSRLDMDRVRSGIRVLKEEWVELPLLDTRLQTFLCWFSSTSRNNEIDDTLTIDILFNRFDESLGKL
jgi:hypothetical protein